MWAFVWSLYLALGHFPLCPHLPQTVYRGLCKEGQRGTVFPRSSKCAELVCLPPDLRAVPAGRAPRTPGSPFLCFPGSTHLVTGGSLVSLVSLYSLALQLFCGRLPVLGPGIKVRLTRPFPTSPPLCQDQTPCSPKPSAPLPLCPAVLPPGPPAYLARCSGHAAPVDFSSPSALVGIKDKNEFYLFF